MTPLNFLISVIILFIIFCLLVVIIVLIRESFPKIAKSRDIDRLHKLIDSQEHIPDKGQFGRVYELAKKVFPNDDDVTRWFNSPNPALGKRKPLDVLSEDKVSGLIGITHLLADLDSGLPTTRFQTIHRSIDQIGFFTLQGICALATIKGFYSDNWDWLQYCGGLIVMSSLYAGGIDVFEKFKKNKLPKSKVEIRKRNLRLLRSLIYGIVGTGVASYGSLVGDLLRWLGIAVPLQK